MQKVLRETGIYLTISLLPLLGLLILDRAHHAVGWSGILICIGITIAAYGAFTKFGPEQWTRRAWTHVSRLCGAGMSQRGVVGSFPAAGQSRLFRIAAEDLDEYASSLKSRGNLNKALHIYFDSAIPLTRQFGDTRLLYTSLFSAAEILKERGKFNQILLQYQGAPDATPVRPMRGGITDLPMPKADLLHSLLICQRYLLPAFEKMNDRRSHALVTALAAEAMQLTGRLDDALRMYREEVIPAMHSLDERASAARALMQIAYILAARGQTDESLRLLTEQVVPEFESLGDSRSRADALSNIAGVHVLRGSIGYALDIYRIEVLPMYDKLNDPHPRAEILVRLAEIIRARGNEVEASRIFRKALSIYEALGDAQHWILKKRRIGQRDGSADPKN